MRRILVLAAMLIMAVPNATVAAWSQGAQSGAPTGNLPLAACSGTESRCEEAWAGSRTSGQHSQAIVLHRVRVEGGEKATVDLPDFGALDIPASKFEWKNGRIHFELVGDSETAVFEGNIAGDAVMGSWHEGEHAGEFTLKRTTGAPKEFREESVSFRNGEVKLAGTLLLPDGRAPSPAIIFVQGAGPERRSASRFLAEYFVKRGIAALIYDKRGAGGSTGDWKHSSYEDLAGDVTAAVSLLKTRPEISSSRIGLMGSSQGGWIAPLAAARTAGIAFVIVKSAAAVTPEQQELARVETQMRGDGYSPAETEQALAVYKHAIAYALTGDGWEPLANEIKADSEKKWALFDRDTPKDYWFFDQMQLTFRHDPIAVLQQLRSPLLVIFGGKDDDGPPLQGQLGKLLEAMQAGGKSSELKIYPGAGHDLRIASGKGAAWDFPSFPRGYLDSLVRWVELQTK